MWQADLKNGECFDAETIDKLQDAIINYYLSDEHVPDFVSITETKDDTDTPHDVSIFNRCLGLLMTETLEQKKLDDDMREELSSPEKTGRI